MCVQGETCDVHVVFDDVALDVARSIGDGERLVRVDKGGRRLGSEERVVSTIAALFGLAVFSANPEVGRTGVHQYVEVLWGGADLHCSNVTDIVGSVVYVRGCLAFDDEHSLTQCPVRASQCQRASWPASEYCCFVHRCQEEKFLHRYPRK